ncbi:aminodeoxychorismate synthase, component I [candidate division GN15 bacterium]|uniref:Aminodeoxychorismate synthase, component I n=1 Tax=candidate division GN15 bacterium TaxID=2072418 RepID=A0A855X242_9BACT|nr:MAG: aminodeoxychorismate synthase, component I [candidate division GN15 bacterium]
MPFTIIPSSIREPFAFYKRLRVTTSHTCFLESLGDLDSGSSRYTFVGALPAEILSGTGDQIVLTNLHDGKSAKVASWLDVLDSWCRISNAIDSASPLQTGAIGYIGYDAKYEFERLTRNIESDINLPDIYLVRYDAVLIHDRTTGKSRWAVTGRCENRIRELEQLANQPAPAETAPFTLQSELNADFTLDGYLDSVHKTTDYIRAGDIFQANITGRFSARYHGNIVHLYERLRQSTPNPFFALFDFPQPVISTSPERFFTVRSGRISAAPIKGTIECVADGVDQRAALERSDKDRAENIMITDLMRNDIGRVCLKDSVQVEALCCLKRFNNLYHLESIISGTLRPGIRISDILRALFPCGSVTGAPKIRAMDIIEELEVTRRGPYTGAIGFFGSGGWIDTSVAIRIVYFDDTRLFVHAGGGIVADSTPEAEYRELLAKLSGISRALTGFKHDR